MVRCYPSVLPVVLGLIHNKPKKSIEKVATLFLYMAKETLSKKKKNTNYQREKKMDESESNWPCHHPPAIFKCHEDDRLMTAGVTQEVDGG